MLNLLSYKTCQKAHRVRYLSKREPNRKRRGLLNYFAIPNGFFVIKRNNQGQEEKSQASRHLMIVSFHHVGPEFAFYFTGRSLLFFIAFPNFFRRIFPLQNTNQLRKYPSYVMSFSFFLGLSSSPS